MDDINVLNPNITKKTSHGKRVFWVILFLLGLAAGIAVIWFAGESLISEATESLRIDAVKTGSAGINTGERAPGFELPDLGGQKVRLDDFFGRPLILVFWASWSRNSVDELNILDGFTPADGEKFFEILTINNQEEKSAVKSFLARGGYAARVLLDENGALGEIYKVRNLPLIYFIDKGGIVRDVYSGLLDRGQILERAEKILR